MKSGVVFSKFQRRPKTGCWFFFYSKIMSLRKCHWKLNQVSLISTLYAGIQTYNPLSSAQSVGRLATGRPKKHDPGFDQQDSQSTTANRFKTQWFEQEVPELSLRFNSQKLPITVGDCCSYNIHQFTSGGINKIICDFCDSENVTGMARKR